MKHIFYTPFTGLGLHNGYRGDTWLKNRIEVFRQFVIPSLIHQSNREFVLWVSFRPEEEGNPLVMDLQGALEGMRNLPFVLTYGGLCFEDDKYDRPESLERLEANLTRSLPELQEVLGEEDDVILTLQPSDDMYLSHTVQAIQDEAEKFDNAPMSIGYRKGYILNMNTLELAEYAKHGAKTDQESTYQTDTIPPFFSVVYPRDVFLDPKAHMEWAAYRSHEYIAEETDYHTLPGRGFIVGTHGENISTTWHHRYRGRMIEGSEKNRIMLQAGLLDPEKVEFKKDPKRKTFNKMPLFMQRLLLRRTDPKLGKAIDGYNHINL